MLALNPCIISALVKQHPAEFVLDIQTCIVVPLIDGSLVIVDKLIVVPLK